MRRTRRNFTAEFKAKVVLEIISGSKSAAERCREYNLKPDLVSHWKTQFVECVNGLRQLGCEFSVERPCLHHQFPMLRPEPTCQRRRGATATLPKSPRTALSGRDDAR